MRDKSKRSNRLLELSGFVIVIFSCLALTSGTLPPDDYTDWEMIQDEDIWIGWTNYADIQWCRSQTVLPYPISKIIAVLEDKANYSEIFDRVQTSTVYENDVVYIKLDMPFPFADRDYVVKYTLENQDTLITYRFKSVKNTDIELNDDCVRLINAAGEWKLVQLDDDRTLVKYTWNGELLGSFPDWALSKAWIEQGNEVLNWLSDALR